MDKPVDKAAKSSKAAKPAAKSRSAGAERVRRHRDKMKAMGLKPVTLWLPDVNSPEFKAQIARDIAAINASADEKVILEELSHIEIDDWK
jgi:hypothetical protein